MFFLLNFLLYFKFNYSFRPLIVTDSQNWLFYFKNRQDLFFLFFNYKMMTLDILNNI